MGVILNTSFFQIICIISKVREANAGSRKYHTLTIVRVLRGIKFLILIFICKHMITAEGKTRSHIPALHYWGAQVLCECLSFQEQ